MTDTERLHDRIGLLTDACGDYRSAAKFYRERGDILKERTETLLEANFDLAKKLDLALNAVKVYEELLLESQGNECCGCCTDIGTMYDMPARQAD